MLRPRFPDVPQGSLSPSANSQQVAELALLIDALPTEYREDVLLAALQAGTDEFLQKSHFVGLYREGLRDCLAAMTGTICDFKRLRQFDLAAIRRRISPFETAADPAKVTIALTELLGFLIESLRLTGQRSVQMPERQRVMSA